MLPTVSFCLQFLYNLRLFRHCEGTAAVWVFFVLFFTPLSVFALAGKV